MSMTMTPVHDHDLYDDDTWDEYTWELFALTTEAKILLTRYGEQMEQAEAEAVFGAPVDAAYAIFKAHTPQSHDGCPTCAALANADIPR